jgi:hypothetical protein
MYKADVKVTITKFRRTNGKFGPDKPKTTPYVDAVLSDLVDRSAVRSKTPVFELDKPAPGRDQTLLIRVPKDYENGAQVTYQLASRKYVMLGIAFVPTGGSGNEVGQNEFPLVSMNRDDESSEMTITDMCEIRPEQTNCYVYGILIQEVATGDIGIFDPAIRHEPREP